MKTFNTAGPTRPDDHYTVPASARWDMEEIRRLIGEKRYFVLHAPRQIGKTSCLLALMERLNAKEDYTALYVNLEPAQAARGNVEAGIRTIFGRKQWGAGHCLRRPAFVLRPSRRTLRAAPGLPQ